jgi:hypothetical protein
MANSAQVAEWKQQYGEVFSILVKEREYIFRALTWKEYDDIVASNPDWSTAEIEDHVVPLAILHPLDFNIDKVSAGLVTVLFQEISEVSGFGSAERVRYILEEEREAAGELRNTMKAFVLMAMPAYTSEYLDDLTLRQMCKLVALAEEVIFVQQLMRGLPIEEKLRISIRTQEEMMVEMQEQMEAHKLKDKGNARMDDPVASKLWQAMND